MSWDASEIAWLALIELFVNSVDKDNDNVCGSFITLVNKLMITASESGKSITTAAYCKSKVDACLAIRVVSQ